MFNFGESLKKKILHDILTSNYLYYYLKPDKGFFISLFFLEFSLKRR